MNWADTLDWLRQSPLLGVSVTVAGYALGRWLNRRLPGALASIAQPVLVAIVVVVAFLKVTGISYTDYLHGGSFIAFLLGPATVALAIPLHREWSHVRQHAIPIIVGVLIGAATSVASAILITAAAGGDEQLQRSMAPKATTTPVSIALSQTLHGEPSLTAIVTIAAGIFGAVVGPAALTLLRIKDPIARGVAIGATSHGIGTARALTESPREGAFSALSMGLTALATSLVIPLLAPLILR